MIAAWQSEVRAYAAQRMAVRYRMHEADRRERP